MFFNEEITLSTLICDEDDRLTLWGLARLFQDVAGDHSDSLGVGFNGLKPYHKAWVLTHVYYNILRFPTAGERLTLKTWAKPDNGLIAPRDYQLIDSEWNVCATSASNWVLIDMDSRRVSRLNDVIKHFEEEDIHATERHRLEKLQVPDNLELFKKIDIPYSSIDHTRHVNNAEYMKWIVDSIEELCMPRNAGRQEIREFEINYLHETKYAEQHVELWRRSDSTDDQNSFFYQVINSGGVAVNARVVIA